MYFHATTALDTDSTAHALAARQNAARKERKLLVAFDGSAAARCALEYAIEYARTSASSIHVVNVQHALFEDAVVYRSQKQAGEQLIKAATARLDLQEVRYTTEVAFGDIAESIVGSAAMERCDLIVIGTRDRLALASFFSASVSKQVVRLAHVPVTVIKQKVVATTHSPRQVAVSTWRPHG